jgi:hypothetical protein
VSRSGASRKSSALRLGGVEVEVALEVELVELGHRGELLRARDRARELLVDPVVEDLVAGLRVGREALDDVVERALGVEHHRPELAVERERLDLAGVVPELLEAEGVGQALGRVDRHDGDLEAAGGHAQRDGGRRGRLADPARSGADADPLAVEHLGDVHTG